MNTLQALFATLIPSSRNVRATFLAGTLWSVSAWIAAAGGGTAEDGTREREVSDSLAGAADFVGTLGVATVVFAIIWVFGALSEVVTDAASRGIRRVAVVVRRRQAAVRKVKELKLAFEAAIDEIAGLVENLDRFAQEERQRISDGRQVDRSAASNAVQRICFIARERSGAAKTEGSQTLGLRQRIEDLDAAAELLGVKRNGYLDGQNGFVPPDAARSIHMSATRVRGAMVRLQPPYGRAIRRRWVRRFRPEAKPLTRSLVGETDGMQLATAAYLRGFRESGAAEGANDFQHTGSMALGWRIDSELEGDVWPIVGPTSDESVAVRTEAEQGYFEARLRASTAAPAIALGLVIAMTWNSVLGFVVSALAAAQLVRSGSTPRFDRNVVKAALATGSQVTEGTQAAFEQGLRAGRLAAETAGVAPREP